MNRLNRMVSDLVDMTRIELGRVELDTQTNDLRDLVIEADELFEDASPIHQLVMDLPPEPLMVCCDATRIGQVLNNLISNAIKYSPQGGVVELRAGTEGRWAWVEVEDHGLGIAPKDHLRIFEPFQRVGRKEEIPGVGLGLSAARRLMEAHEGRIEVESALGKGSTFKIRLPLRQKDEGPKGERPGASMDQRP
ncbi:GAF sensor signal transduction histidine kinase [Vulgatibacter incomptus]|uniref:histidine kinase n=1 Tax=Vulgatibacter incomptus TaxID=1391653 RepID=A0A0K1PGZ4_9BACT|nr:GAF sensor signal transduction histidine kinase [Vulgatibacter incomptus]